MEWGFEKRNQQQGEQRHDGYVLDQAILFFILQNNKQQEEQTQPIS
jgi:hypothetical protein